MRKIYTIGETVYDIIFREGKPEKAVPGGAMLNTAVSLGRCNLPVSLITEMGQDQVGLVIKDFLEKNKVNTRYIDFFKNGNTAISLAFLDKENNASYTFYKNYPEQRLSQVFPDIQKDDMVLFGSFFAIRPEVRKRLMEFIHHAKDQDAIIIYDPNIRAPHQSELESLKKYIFENISLADIIRASDEDFRIIFGINTADKANDLVQEKGCPIMIHTTSNADVSCFWGGMKITRPVRNIKPLSTIGAGDNFNAGIIHSIYEHQYSKHSLMKLTPGEWEKIIEKGIDFATEVCLSMDNYIARYQHYKETINETESFN